MKDEFDFEKELADSIAHIVDEETSGAESFVKNSVNDRTMSIPVEEAREAISEEEEEEDEELARKKKIKHLIITIAVIVFVIALIGVGAFFIVQYILKSSMDNYGYYNNAGYTAWESKNYEEAATNFEKALSYDEGKNDTDMMMYLYECYNNLGMKEEAIDTLYDVLLIKDNNYYNALYYLVRYYDELEDYEKVKELYDANKDSSSTDVLALFSIYHASEPVASPVSDTYSEDQSVTIAVKNGSKIYYTTDGTEPTVNSKEYTGKFQVSEGTTIVKFIAVNEYGFVSDVVTEEYVINYEAPSAPTIYPEKTSFEQANSVMVTINNYPIDAKVYYTMDGTLPDEKSTLYTGAFPLPAGSTIINVLVVDSHGLTCRTSKTYSVTYVSNITEAVALENIWKALVNTAVVDEEHKNAEGIVCELEYFTKTKVDDKTLYMYYFFVDGVPADYWYAADDTQGVVYKVSKPDSNYVAELVE